VQTLAKAAVVGLGLLAGTAATGHAQYYYYGAPNPYYWGSYSYPGYPGYTSGTPSYYYPGYGYRYSYPTYSYYDTWNYPAPKAFWDPYAALHPYSNK